jgi:CO/xanthine dehydrogenase FAD-binding subunit
VRSSPAGYELVAPKSLADALALMAREPGVWRPIAGGTDLMVLFEAGRLEHRKLVSIRGLAELRGVELNGQGALIGPLTTYTEVRRQPALARNYPLLAAAARETGGIATQNRGTIGGNIVNASPAADTPPALIAYDARLELASASGRRIVDYGDFHTGYKTMLLRPDELVARILLPPMRAGARHYYRKVGARRAQAISKVVLAGVVWMDGGRVDDLRIALGSVAPTVLRARMAESALRGRPLDAAAVRDARHALAGEIRAIDDIRSTAAYRERVAQNLLAEFLG